MFPSTKKTVADFLDSIHAQTDLVFETKSDKFTPYYFIAAHTVRGSRFYSETFKSSLDALEVYPQYVDMIQYFGGGQVELFRITEDDYDVISISYV